MAHQRSPVPPLRPRQIPVPDDPAVRQAYLDMGWIQLPGLFGSAPHLKWSKDGIGSPRHPGEMVWESAERTVLQILPFQMTDLAAFALPMADEQSPEYEDVHVHVTIRYRRKYQPRRGGMYGWEAVEATMSVAQEGDQAATACE